MLKLIEGNFGGKKFIEYCWVFRLLFFFFNSVEVIKRVLGDAVLTLCLLSALGAFKEIFVQLPSTRNYGCFVFCEVEFQPPSPSSKSLHRALSEDLIKCVKSLG